MKITTTLPDNNRSDEREIWAVTVLPVARGSDTGGKSLSTQHHRRTIPDQAHRAGRQTA